MLFGAFHFNRNADTIYADKAAKAAKKGDIQNAVKYYEKSFSLGNKKAKNRDKYVNLLINAPLSIESQEKLAQIAEDEIQDYASENAKYFLYNLKREIHNKYPLNYIKQTPYNGKIIHWGKLPITYAFKSIDNVPQEYINAINNAFDEWELKSGHKIYFSKVTNNTANIVIDINAASLNQNIKYGQKYVSAHTTPKVSNDKLQQMIIKFNLRDPNDNFISPNIIYDTALHEIFHALGCMGHSFDKNNIMYIATTEDTIINDKILTLKHPDISTLELLYKIKPDITNADELEYEYIPYLLLGDDEEVQYSKIKEAKKYIRQAPGLPGGYIDLAESLVANKQYAEAIKALEKALRLSTNDDSKYIAYYNLAVCYYSIDNYDIALKYIDYAKEIKNLDELHYLAAESYRKADNTEKAIEEYKYLTERNPQNIDYAISITNIYLKKRKYLEARKILKTFIKNNPKEQNNPKLSQYGLLRL